MTDRIKEYNRDWHIYVIVAIGFAIDTAFIDDGDIYGTIIWLLLFTLVLVRKEIRFDIGDLFLFLGMFSYVLISGWSIVDSFAYGMRIVAAYQIGKYLACPWEITDCSGSGADSITDWIAFVVLVFSTVLFFRGILNYSYLITDYRAISAGEWFRWRWSVPAWGKALRPVVLGHTHHQFYIIVMGSLIAYYTASLRNKGLLNLVGMVFSVIAIVLGSLTEGKMCFICSLLSAVISLFISLTKRGLLQSIKTWVAIGAVVDIFMLFTVLHRLKIFGSDIIWSAEDSAFYTNRFIVQAQAIRMLPTHLLGGYDTDMYVPGIGNVYFAQNSWLDLAVQAGIIPFTFSVGFLIVIILYFRVIQKKSENNRVYMLICAFAGVTMYHMLEPAIIANLSYWNTEVFLGGLACGLYSNYSGEKGLVLCLKSLRRSIPTS